MPIEIVIDMPPCEGCCGPGCAELECRVAFGAGSGIATLCGFVEFTDPSLPPKKYRTRTWTADYVNCSYSALGCPAGGHGVTYHKNSISPPCVCSVDADTCVETDTGLDRFGGEGDPSATCSYATLALTASQAPPSCLSGPSSPFAAGGSTDTITKTTAQYTGNSTCVPTGVATSSIYIGSTQFDLTDEDTIFDAIDRTGYDSFGDWGPCSDNYSFITVREAGDYNSTFAKAEARRCCSNLEVGVLYSATLRTEWRLTGSSDPFEEGPETTITFTPGSSEECVTIDVPLVDQYEVVAVDIVIIKV